MPYHLSQGLELACCVHVRFIPSMPLVMNVKKAILVLAVLLGLTCGLMAFLSSINGYIADPAFFYSHVTSSPNNRFVFVMLGPVALSPDGGWRDEHMEQSRVLQSKYPASGLYLNDGSTTPFWKIDKYSWKVFVPSDGAHLAMPAPWPTAASDEALSFYENGNLSRTYRVRDLIDVPWLLPGGHQHFDWERNISLDDQNRRLSVTTQHYDHYVFDMFTGEIVSARRPSRVVFAVFVVILFCVLVRWRGKRLK